MDKLPWKEKIQEFLKSKNKILIYAILIIGVIFMICSGKGDKEKEVSGNVLNVAAEEERLETILSDIKNAGSVSVMITYYSSEEKDIAYEVKSNYAEDSEDIDKRAVLSDGSPVVVREVYPEVKGVIVTAEGADNTEVAHSIKEAVVAALDVPVHKVCVYPKNRR